MFYNGGISWKNSKGNSRCNVNNNIISYAWSMYLSTIFTYKSITDIYKKEFLN